MIKKNKYLIIELILIFLVTIIYNLISSHLDFDEIWNYGFSYNIASGLIPYKDFNMIITPLFPILGGIFLYIFGKNIVVYYIFNAIICTTLFYYLKKHAPNNYYLSFHIVLVFSSVNYNMFCLLLLYILISLEDKKANDYLIGIIIGIVLITKQNIGLLLFLPSLLTKDIKKIFKRIIGLLIPTIIMFIYLILNNCLYEFIDYTILGLGSFTKDNAYTTPLNILLIIVSIIYLIYKYIKTKDIKLIYILCFQGIVFPIFNNYHVVLSIIPTFTYALSKININPKVNKYYFIIVISVVLSLSTHQIIKEGYKYPNDTINYKYKKLDNDLVDMINNVSNYITKTDGKIFIIDATAYILKLESSLPINKYDLLNDGNLGKGGREEIFKEIDEICDKEKCTFIINKQLIGSSEYRQYNDELYYYVIDNYMNVGEIRGLSIYKNH